MCNGIQENTTRAANTILRTPRVHHICWKWQNIYTVYVFIYRYIICVWTHICKGGSLQLSKWHRTTFYFGKAEILRSIFYSCTSSWQFQKETMSIASNTEGWGRPGGFSLLFISFFPICACRYGRRGLSSGMTLPGREGLNYCIQISTKPSEIMDVNRYGGRNPALKGVPIVISSHFGAFFSTVGLWALHPGVTGRGAWSLLMDLGYTELMLTFSEQ